MKTPNLVHRFLGPALLIFLLASCKGVGIFSTLAVTEKVVDGSIPDGISADAGVLYASGITPNWAFFSAGPSMWAKDLVTADAAWKRIPLPSDYNEYAIQSIASTANYILLSAVGTSGGSRTTTLYYVASGDVGVDGTLTYNPIVTWTSTNTEYYNASVFSTGMGNTFYINRLTSDDFDTDDADITASELYSWNGSLSGPDGNFDINLNTWPNFRYVTDVADGGGGALFTVQDEDSEAGRLLDSTGGAVAVVEATTAIDYSTRPFSSIEWLGGTVSAYFMGIATISSPNNGALLVSSDGITWYTVDNVDNDDTYVSFVDVSDVAGSNWILAGRDICGEDGGYEQIDVDTAAIGTDTWFVSNGDFADSTSYISTDMADVTITDFTIIGTTLYASTRYAGIYSLNIGGVGNEWVEE